MNHNLTNHFVEWARWAFNNPHDLGKVAVIYGGETTEREVSVQSGKAVAEELRKAGVKLVEFEVHYWKELLPFLNHRDFDLVFNLIHGSKGEDGSLHSLLDLLKIPYVGSQLTASALAMNKLQCKRMVSSIGVQTAKYAVSLGDAQQFEVQSKIPSYPVVVKPVSEGSSNGVTKVNDEDELKKALSFAHQFDNTVLVEQYIEGIEVTVPVIDGKALEVIEIVPFQGMYDYHAKYEDNKTEFYCPPRKETKTPKNLALIAEEVCQVLEMRHWGRVDFVVDQKGQPWFLEVNLIPGMTSHSLVPMSAKQAGLSFGELVCGLVYLVKR